jgi:hypothetical protein
VWVSVSDCVSECVRLCGRVCQIVWASVSESVGECISMCVCVCVCVFVCVSDFVSEYARFFPGSPFRTAVTRTLPRLYKSSVKHSMCQHYGLKHSNLIALRKMRR